MLVGGRGVDEMALSCFSRNEEQNTLDFNLLCNFTEPW